jgi:type VI protein secretion system component Hcp
MKTLFIGALAVLMSASASADRNQSAQSIEHQAPQSVINVSVSGFTCATSVGTGVFSANSWSWGASNSGTTSGGGGSGKTTVTGLTIKKEFDACSPSLFAATVGGKHLGGLILSEIDSNGVVVAKVQLNDVTVTSWNVGSSTKESTPDETVIFAFTKICITNTGASTTCYDLTTGKI